MNKNQDSQHCLSQNDKFVDLGMCCRKSLGDLEGGSKSSQRKDFSGIFTKAWEKPHCLSLFFVPFYLQGQCHEISFPAVPDRFLPFSRQQTTKNPSSTRQIFKKIKISETPASELDGSCLMIETKSKECPDTVFFYLKIIPFKERQWWPIKI
jgi:hypothetical protein